MVRKIREFFKQPFPFDRDLRRKWKYILGIGAFISVFVWISGMAAREGVYNPLIIAGFGVITSMALAFSWLVLPLIAPRFFLEENWYVGKEIALEVWILFLIGFGNLLYANWGGYYPINLQTFVRSQVTTVLVGILPITFTILLRQKRLLKKYAAAALDLDRSIRSPDFAKQSEDILSRSVSLSSASGTDRVRIRLGSLLFVKSVDNYVEIFWEDEKEVRNVLLRGSLKRIEKELKSYPPAFRCHRTYLVNISNIDRITGNSQGYRLKIKGSDKPIPVSRRYSREFRRKIA
ncbi:MAG: LytTR family transcriptional regulator DNA-binding domain-containing protein [Candidatus Aminicenantes bacterium]|nr:LytTR family transcriptional regulator DNA-binding domain-containing protein [Candidatus Aminicenantes bacterium]